MEKYIVYKTTNLVNNYIYIGVHKTETPYQFDKYLGNGIYINKPCTYDKAKTKMQQAVKEFGVKNFRRETLQVFDTDKEAYFLEGILVDEEFLKRPDVYNMVLGGEMQEYRTVPTYKYSLDGIYLSEYPTIKSAAKEIKVRNSTLCQALLYKRSCGGFYWSSEKVDKLDISNYNIPIKTLKVYIYNLDGEYINEFDSCNEAAKFIGAAGVERAARLGYIVNKEYYASFIKMEKYEDARSLYIKTRPVFKYDSDGKFIQGYDTQSLAEQENKGSNISKAIKNKSVDINGFMWGLEKLDYYNVPKKNAKKRVGMFDDNGNLIKTWDSGRQCSLEYGRGVYHCLKGEYPKHKNYIFKYIN